jgi:oxygen-dependent protoporphyrinogen oxidase
VKAIADRLPADCVRLSTVVDKVEPISGGGWNVNTGEEDQRFDGVIVATSSDVTARLMQDIDDQAADILSQIPHSVCSIVSLCYERSQISHPMDGFGFVVPQIENRRILSGSFSSIKYAGRAPDGSVLIRVFVGGTQQAELADLDEKALIKIASEELSDLLHIDGAPTNSHVTRHAGLMPQYYVGHLDRMKQLRERTDALRGLFLAGNAYNGVGLPQCIRSGESAAAYLVESIG